MVTLTQTTSHRQPSDFLVWNKDWNNIFLEISLTDRYKPHISAIHVDGISHKQKPHWKNLVWEWGDWNYAIIFRHDEFIRLKPMPTGTKNEYYTSSAYFVIIGQSKLISMWRHPVIKSLWRPGANCLLTKGVQLCIDCFGISSNTGLMLWLQR